MTNIDSLFYCLHNNSFVCCHLIACVSPEIYLAYIYFCIGKNLIRKKHARTIINAQWLKKCLWKHHFVFSILFSLCHCVAEKLLFEYAEMWKTHVHSCLFPSHTHNKVVNRFIFFRLYWFRMYYKRGMQGISYIMLSSISMHISISECGLNLFRPFGCVFPVSRVRFNCIKMF